MLKFSDPPPTPLKCASLRKSRGGHSGCKKCWEILPRMRKTLLWMGYLFCKWTPCTNLTYPLGKNIKDRYLSWWAHPLPKQFWSGARMGWFLKASPKSRLMELRCHHSGTRIKLDAALNGQSPRVPCLLCVLSFWNSHSLCTYSHGV